MYGLRQGLIELGAHIGTHQSKVHPAMNSFLIGRRKEVAIIELNTTMIQLRKAQAFMKDVGKRGGHVLFYHGNMHNYGSMIQAAAISIFRNKNFSYMNLKWPQGLLTNYNTQFKEAFDLIVEEETEMETMNLRWLFIRVLMHVVDKKTPSVEWYRHMKDMNKFWRLLSLFKLYKICNKLPDVMVYINPERDYIPVREANYLGIPIVGTLDTDHSNHRITYPIVTNDDSILLSLFYFELLTKAYEDGEKEMLAI